MKKLVIISIGAMVLVIGYCLKPSKNAPASVTPEQAVSETVAKTKPFVFKPLRDHSSSAPVASPKKTIQVIVHGAEPVFSLQ